MKKLLIILSSFIILFLVIILSISGFYNYECNKRCLKTKEDLQSVGMTQEWGLIVSGECREVPIYLNLEQQGVIIPWGKCEINKYCDCKLDTGKFMSEDNQALSKIKENIKR